MNKDIKDSLSKLISVFGAQRVIQKSELEDVLKAIVAILGENKKGVESLNNETKVLLEQAKKYIETEHSNVLKSIENDLGMTKSKLETATKQQNDRAFKRLQTLIAAINMPKDGEPGLPGQDGLPGKDGAPGKDGSPDSPLQVRDKLETLKNDDRLDWTAIKGLPDYLKMAKKAGRQMLVGGIRFFENLADVSIITTNKRQDLIAQYDTTNNRWQDGVAITVGTTPPANPKIGDLWVDLNP
jgi:hypothetical protein